MTLNLISRIKRTNKSKLSERKEVREIRAEINKIENKHTLQKTHKAKIDI